MTLEQWSELANRNARANTYLHNKYIKASGEFLACPFWRIFRFIKLNNKSNRLYKIARASSDDYMKFLDDWKKVIFKT